MTFGTESDKLREVTGLQSTVLRRHGAKITQLLTNTTTDYCLIINIIIRAANDSSVFTITEMATTY